LCSGLGQATYTCVPLSPSSIIWYRPIGGYLFGWESNRRQQRISCSGWTPELWNLASKTWNIILIMWCTTLLIYLTV